MYVFKWRLVRCGILTYTWCRVLLEQLPGLHLVKKFPAFHGTGRFITALTSVRHLSLSWASPIQSVYPHPTSWRSILILSTHLTISISAVNMGMRLDQTERFWKQEAERNVCARHGRSEKRLQKITSWGHSLCVSSLQWIGPLRMARWVCV